MSPPRYNAEFDGDKHMNAADATRISYVYVRIVPKNVAHLSYTLIHPPTGACPARTPWWFRKLFFFLQV